MLTIMDLLKKSSASKLEKMIEEQKQPVAFVVASLLEAQLNGADNTQKVAKVFDTPHSNPKTITTNTVDGEYSEDGIFATWKDYPKRAAKAFTSNNIKTPRELVSNYDFKMMSELHGVGASTAQKVFEKLREDGFVKNTKDMGSAAASAPEPVTKTTATQKPAASVTKNASPKIEADDDQDAVATDWYGKITSIDPLSGAKALGSARTFFANAWNISEKEAMQEFNDLGIVEKFKADSSPKNISHLITAIANNLPAHSNMLDDINTMITKIQGFGGTHNMEDFLTEFDKTAPNLLTVKESKKIYNELEYDLQSFKDAQAHKEQFASGEDDEFEDDEDDMPF